MADLILHQYAISPFSEKVRRVLAFKGVPFRTVDQPVWNPKPELVPLTGGYRRIPVLQIGADVYCDTACILRTIEALHPEPSVMPKAQPGLATMLTWWADRQLFTVAAGVVLSEIGQALPPEFREDREKLVPGLKFDALPAQAPFAREQLRVMLGALAAQLGSNAFVLGDRFSLADAACYHVCWFARAAPAGAAIVDSFPSLVDWMGRVAALGPLKSTPLAAAEALEIAKRAEPARANGAGPADPSGLKPGDRVTAMPDDYGFDPVAGELAALDPFDVAIRRRDPALGDVTVHFPRAGYRVAPA
jgi:glutathione S-transferase